MTFESLLLKRLAKEARDHSIFAPSSSSMWMGCSGSLIPNILAEDDGSFEAAEGTVAHGLAEEWLKSGKKPKHMLGKRVVVEAGEWGYLITVDESMMEHIEQYVDWVSMLPGDHYVETRVDISRITPIPNQRGTADHAACKPGRLTITDFKYGKGIFVRVVRNTQLLLYALGIFYEWDWIYDFQEICIRIAQPRLGNFDEWVISREELLEFEEYARERAHAAWRLNAPRTPSESACEWCKVRASCPAIAKLHADLTAAAFDAVGREVRDGEVLEFMDELSFSDGLRPIPISDLSLNDMAFIYKHEKLFRKWWDDIGDTLRRRALDGETVPDHKLVESRSIRVFRSEARAARRLAELGVPKDRIWRSEVISPAQAEAELKKVGYRSSEIPDLLADLVYKPAGKPTLVPLSDKRPALEDLSASAFEDLTADR